MPKYDYRCQDHSHVFELTRSFGTASEPAYCPEDGSAATRLFSPPLDLLMYRREPVVPTVRTSLPAGALSCHDHGPPPSAEHGHHESGSAWHSHGYTGSHSHGHRHAHGHEHAHSH